MFLCVSEPQKILIINQLCVSFQPFVFLCGNTNYSKLVYFILFYCKNQPKIISK